MLNKKSGNRFDKKMIHAESNDNSPIWCVIINRLTQKVSTRVGAAAVSALIALHFISQFIFFQNENVYNDENTLKPAIEQVIEIKPEQVNAAIAAPPLVKTMPDAITHKTNKVIVQQPVRKIALPVQKTVKKKQIRETRAERLRRAEKILTGV
jgi:hypothetical protein